jgi:predicted nuclease with RNAse H fold
LITLGIDLAAQKAKTGLCLIEWGPSTAAITELQADVSDELILDRAQLCEKIGIDIPLGWPAQFALALPQFAASGVWAAGPLDDFCYRMTDMHVERVLGSTKKKNKRPLSVSADKLGRTAIRAAQLFRKLQLSDDRSGRDKVVEVYPAAALALWNMQCEGYKKNKSACLAELVTRFSEEAKWLTISAAHSNLCRKNNNAFDALISAIMARISAAELTLEIPDESKKLAREEGWIALPKSKSIADFPKLLGSAHSA